MQYNINTNNLKYVSSLLKFSNTKTNSNKTLIFNQLNIIILSFIFYSMSICKFIWLNYLIFTVLKYNILCYELHSYFFQFKSLSNIGTYHIFIIIKTFKLIHKKNINNEMQLISLFTK